MSRSRRLLLAAVLPLGLAAPATAAGAPFAPPQTLDLPVTGPLAAAVGPRGDAVVAGVVSGAPVQARIEVATRSTAAAPWRLAGFGTAAGQIRDVQVVIGRSGTVIAWAENRRHSRSVVVATADAAAHLTIRARFAVGDAFAAYPRLAVLRSGAVVAAWRDGRFGARSRVRVATIDGGRPTAPRTAGANASQIVLAARARGATVGWTSQFRAVPRTGARSVPRALPRTLTVRSLDAHGLPTGAAVRVGSDVGATARLAGAPDGRVVASWMRPQKIRSYAGEDRGDAPPPSAYIAPRAFTRQLLPRLAPARPLGGPSEIAAGVPSVGFDGPGHAVAALRASAPAVGPAYDARLSGSAGGGPWSGSRLVAHLGFSRLDPVVTVPSPGDAVVVYTALIPAPGTPVWSVGAADATGTQALGVTNAGDGRGIAVARAADRVLVAWPSAGGVQVAERSGA